MSRILFLTKYDRNGASSRYRIFQYLPFLEERGIEYDVQPLFPKQYLDARYRSSSAKNWRLLALVVQSYARRLSKLWRQVDHYDAVYVEYELFPYLPFMAEQWLFNADVPVVVDYDDAIYSGYQFHANGIVRAFAASKIPDLVRRSAHVVVANRHLERWARHLNANVTLIPTSVDLRKYPVPQDVESGSNVPVIGWIGTPVTARYLSLLEQPLRSLRIHHDFVLKIVGAPDFTMAGVDICHVPWDESTEVQELQTCIAGIMPLPNSPWAQGKSALKLIQYLAAGIVGIASPVGANCDVIQDNYNGLLAHSAQEWVDKLSIIISQPDLRRKLAASGRKTAESFYSVQANAPRWLNVLESVLVDKEL